MPATSRWDHLARLLVLHGEVCAALALLRTRGDGPGPAISRLEEMAQRQRELAGRLVGLARARGSPRELRAAARRHAHAVAQLLA